MNTNFKMNIERIKVSVSTPFPCRARCKKCLGGPTNYFSVRNQTMFYNARKSTDICSFICDRIKRFNNSYYLDGDPKSMISIQGFSYAHPFKSYRPKLHRTRNTDPIIEISEYFCCDCGNAKWAFSDKSARNKPEIFSKKSTVICFEISYNN